MDETWLRIAEMILSRNTNFWLITTVVLIIYIGFGKAKRVACAIKNKEMCGKTKEKDTCAELSKKDYIYLVVMMVILSVILTSLALYTDKEAMQLFSFASTITSIILSVIAIIMTITSESKNALTKDILTKSATEIEEATKSVERFTTKIDSYKLGDINASINHLDDLLTNAIQKIESLDDKVGQYITVDKKNATAKINYPSSGKEQQLYIVNTTDYREQEGENEFTDKN